MKIQDILTEMGISLKIPYAIYFRMTRSVYILYTYMCLKMLYADTYILHIVLYSVFLFIYVHEDT